MQKVGMAVRIEFVTSNLPACVRKTEVVANLFSHLLTSGEKSMTLGFVRLRGRPRLVKGKLPMSQLKLFARCCNLVLLILMRTITNFELFTFSPVDSPKVFSKALRVYNCLLQASITTSVSSSYCITRKSVVYLRGIGSFNNPWSFALFITGCSRSAVSTKRRGDNAPPLLPCYSERFCQAPH